MATSAIGLKTQIWNNNIKVLLFLLLYPMLLIPFFLILEEIVLFVFSVITGDVKHFFSTISIKHLILHYWYVPYLVIAVISLCIYWYERNRIDLSADIYLVTRQRNASLFKCLENLCISRGMRTPMLFIKDYFDSANAYSLGFSSYTTRIITTSGLIEHLNEEEVEAVLANTLVHIINGDTKLLYLIGFIIRIFDYIDEVLLEPDNLPFFLGLLFKPLSIFIRIVRKACFVTKAGELLARMFISTKREFIADAGAVELTKNPQALISAMHKLKSCNYEMGIGDAYIPLLFFYNNVYMPIPSHPSIESRIEALERINRIIPQ